MIRRKIMVMATVSLMVFAVFPGLAAAGERPGDAVYLSLGTSLAAGSLADSDGNTTASSNVSYTDQLYRRLRGQLAPHLTHVKLGCAGETTDQMGGGLNAFGQPSLCVADYATGSQLGDALATLATREVALITIDIGANDGLQAQIICEGDPVCLGEAIPVIAAKVAGIVATLRGAGYSGLIVGMNYYNSTVTAAIGFYPGLPGPLPPSLELAILSDQLTQAFNGALEAAYAATGAEVADVYQAFNAGDFGDDRPANGIPDNVDRACSLTFLCPSEAGVLSNIHPNKKGYKTIARAFQRVVQANV